MMVKLIAANLKKTVVLVSLAGFIIGFLNALKLTEEESRRIRKALFELNELPRRIFI